MTAIQYGGQIQLLYTDATRHSLRHAWWNGTRWNFETLDGAGAGGGNGRIGTPVAGSTIAFKQFGSQVHAFYSDDTTHKLRHGWWNGTQWTFENLDTSATLSSTAFISAAQLGTTVHVVTKTSSGALRHGWYSGGWHYETVDGTGGVSGSTGHNVGDFATMVPFGTQLDVAYRDNTNSSVRHAWLTGSTWHFETIDGTGGVASGATGNHVGSSIALLPYGSTLHVVYQDTTSGVQRHAWYDGSWHAEILDGSGSTKAGASNSTNTGLNNSLAVFGGQLHVSYFDHAKGDTFRHSWVS